MFGHDRPQQFSLQLLYRGRADRSPPSRQLRPLGYRVRPPPLFFFSSRRRHTRWPRDWSSDVCSSDLDPDDPFLQPPEAVRDDKRRPSPPVERLRLLVPAGEPLPAAAEGASAMLSRQTPLAAPDLADLTALVDALLAAGG